MPRLVGIVGSRKFPITQKDTIVAFINRLPMDTIVVSGGAIGVDTWAEETAKARGMRTPIIFYPKWRDEDGNYDKRAGFIRNQKIVEASEEIFAFYDGKSRGTANTIQKARSMGKKVTIFKPDTSPEAQKLEEMAQIELKRSKNMAQGRVNGSNYVQNQDK